MGTTCCSPCCNDVLFVKVPISPAEGYAIWTGRGCTGCWKMAWFPKPLFALLHEGRFPLLGPRGQEGWKLHDWSGKLIFLVMIAVG